eukprot:GGOE01048598.1.p3 GENE.GGOE01048598.1~~GGOE01048598.1.p3  ORF type:complete len:144 (+),score=4.33 GGOE01048598.1:690-1121(+)
MPANPLTGGVGYGGSMRATHNVRAAGFGALVQVGACIRRGSGEDGRMGWGPGKVARMQIWAQGEEVQGRLRLRYKGHVWNVPMARLPAAEELGLPWELARVGVGRSGEREGQQMSEFDAPYRKEEKREGVAGGHSKRWTTAVV